MARTRQKAKQRQAKRREQERKAQGTTGQKPPSNPAEQAVVDQAHAYEVGDVLEESGGDVDEAEERLEQEPSEEAIGPVDAPPAVEAPPARTATKTRERRERKPRPADDDGDGRGGRGGRRGAGRGAAAAGQARPARKREARQRGRVINFLIQVWAELRRVQWPDRTQVTQATAVVIVFCILAGLYLAFFDYIFAKLVKVIL
jgi:preprotein translocase subunit SecE